jgi:drug/metabolite transporter (DMT)-like permease
VKRTQSAPDNRIVSRRTAWLLLATVIVLWGANWPVMKVGLGYLPPVSFAATRLLLGALTVALVAAWRGELQRPARQDVPVVLGVGLLQMAGYLGLVTFGLQYVPAGRSAILAYTTSLWVVPMASMLLGERLSGLKLAGFCLGLGGVLVLFNPFGFDWTDPDVILGNGLLLLAALLWAILIVQVRGHRMAGSPLSLAPWQFAIGALFLVPLAVVLEGGREWDWSPTLVAILVYNGPLATAFCFWAMITITRSLPAITTSLSSLGVPVFGLVVSALTIGEPLTATNVGGLLLIILGLACVTLSDSRPRRATAAAVPAEPRPGVADNPPGGRRID